MPDSISWGDLIRGLPPDLQGLLAEAEPYQVIVSKAEQSWKLFLRTEHLLTAGQLDQVAAVLRARIPELRQVRLIQKLTNRRRLEQMIGERRAELDAFCLAVQPVGAFQWGIYPDYVMLETQDLAFYNALLDGDAADKISQWFEMEYGLRLVARIYLRSQLDAVSAPDYIYKDQGADYLQEENKKAGYHNRRTSKTHWKQQAAMPLNQVLDDSRGVVVEGEVFLKKYALQRNGRIVVTYYLTDYTDSLLLKRYLTGEQADDIKEKSWIKATGDVRYDPYAKESALYIDAHCSMERPHVRRDVSAEKRVELHAHTTMSAMDGLTDPAALIDRAEQWGHPAVAVTDHGCVQAFPLVQQALNKTRKDGGSDAIKVIYGMEGYLVEEDKKERAYHIILLAANLTGLKNLYALVSLSYLENFYRQPKLLRRQIIAHREGLLLGSACAAGELFQALLREEEPERIRQIVDFYDYLEIQPLCNNAFLLKNGAVSGEAELQRLTGRIVALGREAGKYVAATGDVHFLEPEHQISRAIIQAGQGYADVETPAPLYFRTTEEMLQEFSFLGEEDARWTVCTCPTLIAGQIQRIPPVPAGFYPPVIDTAEEQIVELTWTTARNIYGRDGLLPDVIQQRIQHELASITANNFSVLYLIAHQLVKKSNADGYLVGSRGSVGSSLAAFFLGITEVNALKPHYLCPTCHYFALADSRQYGCGADLPEEQCPECGQPLGRHGFDIPFETFLGFEGDKVPDIDLNFSGDYQAKAHQYVEELFGRDNVFRAGTISTIGEKTAFGFVKKYQEEQHIVLKDSEISRLAMSITGVRRTTGQHPGGIIVVPKGHHITEFTPIQYPADNKDSGVVTTHFEYHAMQDQLVKLDILGHDDPTVIRTLEDLTGIPAQSVSLSDPVTMQLFSGLDPLGLAEEQILSRVGTYGIPEFGTPFVRKMLEATNPATFSELVRISGLSHGTDVWSNNAEDLIKAKTVTLKEAICIRDDIMNDLIEWGMEAKPAFDIMEHVRRGKGLTEQETRLMQEEKIPDWYIRSCNKIKYMFPKAHAVAYVTMAYRIAWYKINCPLAFYSSYFTVRASDAFEIETVLAGYDAVKKRIQDIYKMNFQATSRDKKIAAVLEVALEMLARGFVFYPVDIISSEARTYQIQGNGLLLPFSAFPNMGDAVCGALVSAREAGPFISVEDFQYRSKANKTAIELMRAHGCFAGLPETTQIDLFS